jgi:hypothetical protein
MKTAKYKLPYNIKNTEYKNGFIYIELNKPKEIIIKTAMQEFFMVLKEFNKELYNTMYNEGILDTAIEKEKEQIIYDYNNGVNDGNTQGLQGKDGNGNYATLEEYYNQTYKPETI